jgi:acid phosphatase (class A)
MATDTATRNARDAADDSLWKFRPAMGQNFTPENCKKIEIFLTKAAIDANNIKTDLKDSFQRARPVPRPGATDERDGDFSFPSGHATRAGLRYRLLSAIAPDREVDLLKEGWLMCMDRMIVGMHYPTDITAGFVLGERIADEILKAAAEDPGSACAGDLRGAMEEWRGVSR